MVSRTHRPLRVAMDTQCLETARTGIRTYVERLQSEFARNSSESGLQVDSFRGPKLLPTNKSWQRLANQGIRFYWWHIWLPIRLLFGRYDVLFSPDLQVPAWSPIPRVVTIHDAAVIQRPEDYNRLWHLFFKRLMLPAIRRAPAVVTISHYSAKEIASGLSLRPERIHIIPNGGPAAGEFAQISENFAATYLAKLHLQPYNYILHMGNLARNKNLVTLVKAFSLWRQQGGNPTFKLVLAGPHPTQSTINDVPQIMAAIAQEQLIDWVILTGHVTDEERAALYTHAAVVTVPSILEGFGLPILDGFAARVPVIASTATSLPEVAGDAALMFDPQQPQQIADALQQLASDPALRKELVRRGELRLQQFSWAQAATDLQDIFRQVARS